MTDSEDGMRGPPAKKKKKTQETLTIRCQVNIPEFDEGKELYTEVNWLDLVSKEESKRRKAELKKKEEKSKQNGTGGLDPYASDDDDQLKALAAQLEAKYAEPAPKKKKGIKRRKNFDDIGDGYDETDPFIDNSECFDENVPQEVTTEHGGFYINTGVLEFKDNKNRVYEVSDSSDSDDDKEKKPAAKKKQTPNGMGIPIKKAKMINTKKRARMITTPVNSGPKNGKPMTKGDDGIKIIGEVKKDAKPKVASESQKSAKSKEEKSGKSEENGAKMSTSGTSITNLSGKAGTILGNNSSIKITAVSSTAAPDSSATPKSASGSSKSDSCKAVVNGSKPETKAATSTGPKVSNTISVRPSSQLLKEASKPVKEASPKPVKEALKPTKEAPKSLKEVVKPEKKDLKAERKVTSKTVGKSSPKPPEFIDLENQLNELNDLASSFESSPKSSPIKPSVESRNNMNKPSSSISSRESSPAVKQLPGSSVSITRVNSPQGGSSSQSSEKGPTPQQQSSKSASNPFSTQSDRLSQVDPPNKSADSSKTGSSKIATDKMYNHNPASILASSISSSGNTSSTTTSKPSSSADRSKTSSYSLTSVNLADNRTSLTKVTPARTPSSQAFPSSLAQTAAVLAKVSPKTSNSSPVSSRTKSPSFTSPAGTTSKKGSELSQQLGRQAAAVAAQQQLQKKTANFASVASMVSGSSAQKPNTKNSYSSQPANNSTKNPRSYPSPQQKPTNSHQQQKQTAYTSPQQLKQTASNNQYSHNNSHNSAGGSVGNPYITSSPHNVTSSSLGHNQTDQGYGMMQNQFDYMQQLLQGGSISSLHNSSQNILNGSHSSPDAAYVQALQQQQALNPQVDWTTQYTNATKKH